MKKLANNLILVDMFLFHTNHYVVNGLKERKYKMFVPQDLGMPQWKKQNKKHVINFDCFMLTMTASIYMCTGYNCVINVASSESCSSVWRLAYFFMSCFMQSSDINNSTMIL